MAGKRRKSRSAAMAIPTPSDERENISVRKITNGYLIEKSGVKRGKYVSHTEYSPGRPVIAASVPAAKPAKAAPKGKRSDPGPVPLREVGFLRSK